VLGVSDTYSWCHPQAADDGRVRRDVAGAALAVSCAVFLVLCWALRGFVTDDSWISVRYAENLATGAGPVWNPGGPRAEGYSNPLLVGLEALADLAGWSAMSAARAIGVVCGLACVVLVHRAGAHVVGQPAAAVGALLTGASAPFALWAVGGLETTATALVLTAGVLSLARRGGGHPAVAGAVLALLPWLRPEGLVAALAVAGLGEAPGLLRAAGRRRALRRLAVVAGVPVLSQVVLEVVRLAVYGHLLPNSVLYKAGTGETVGVAMKFLEHSALVVALAVVGAVLVRGRARLLAVPAAVYLAGSIGTRDSANAFSRFFMPVWPQLALLAGVAVVAAVLAVVSRGRPSRVARATTAATAVGGVVVAVLAVGALPGNIRDVDGWQQRYMGCRVAAREDVVRWLLAETPPGTLFAISDAGYVPARAGGRPAVDNFMLNDPLIQTTGPLSPGERAEEVHRRRPDVLVLASRDATTFDPVYPTEREIHDHPAAAAFSLSHVGSGDLGCGYHLMVFGR
jgi:hypothetical protein